MSFINCNLDLFIENTISRRLIVSSKLKIIMPMQCLKTCFFFTVLAVYVPVSNCMHFTSHIELRNESNIFSVDQSINQKRTENCSNARSALLQKFSVIFSVDTSINRKKYLIYFLSFNVHFI